MKIHFYVNVNELETLNKLIKGKLDTEKNKVTISPVYFKDSYLIDIPYYDFVRLNDQKIFTSLISL